MGLSFLAPYNDFEKEINFTGTSTITNGNTQVVPLSTGLGLNVPTGGSHALSVNGTSALTVSAALATLDTTNGIYFTGTTGTVTGSSRQITGSSNGLSFNTPSSTVHTFRVNDVSVAVLTGTDWNIGTLGASGYSIRGNSLSQIVHNVPTGALHTFNVNNVTQASIDTTGLALFAGIGLVLNATGTVTAASRQVIGTSAGLEYNTPTGTAHILNINGAGCFSVQALVVALATTNGLKFNTSSGTATGGNREIVPASTGIIYNTPTGTSHILAINGTTSASLSSTALTLTATKGLFINSNGGSALGSTSRQIWGNSGGLSIESVGTFYLYHAGVNTATFTASSGLTFAAARTSTPNTCSVCRDDVAGNMRFNVAFNGEYYIGHNGTTTFLTLSQTGIRLADGVEFTNLGKGNVFTSAGGTVATSSTTLVYNLNNKSGRIWFFDGNGGWAIFRFTAATGSVTREDGSAKWVASASPASDEAGVAVSGTSINLYMGSAASSAARRVGWHVFNMSHI